MHTLTLGLLLTLTFLASFLLIGLMVPAFIWLIEHLSAKAFPNNRTDQAAARIASKQEAAMKAAERAMERAGHRAQKIREESAEALLDGGFDGYEGGGYAYQDEEDFESDGGGGGDGGDGDGGGFGGGFFDAEALQYGAEDLEENAGVVKVGSRRKWW